MIRNWEVIRLILEQIEGGTLYEFITSGKADKHHLLRGQDAILLGHVELLIDAGILKHCSVTRNSAGDFVDWDFRGVYITMQGHDLLDALRDENVWDEIKEKAKIAGVTISWEFIKAAIPLILTKYAAGMF